MTKTEDLWANAPFDQALTTLDPHDGGRFRDAAVEVGDTLFFAVAALQQYCGREGIAFTGSDVVALARAMIDREQYLTSQRRPQDD